MEDLDELILMQLKGINEEAGPFVVGILNDDISRDEQISFAHRLVDLAEAIRDRALQTPGMVIEGGVVDGSDGRALTSETDGRADHTGLADDE
jgi:hypothetical protein